VEELNQKWSLIDRKTRKQLSLDSEPESPLVIVELEESEGGEFMPGCGQLVAERRVGGGRIVATAFSLTDRAVVNWGSYDSFINGCILRRPPRRFKELNMTVVSEWAIDNPPLAADSRPVTTLRYFSRDIGHFAFAPTGTRHVPEPGEERLLPARQRDGVVFGNPYDDQEREVISEQARNPQGDSFHFNGYPLLPDGVAAWNDRSGASDAARQSLKDAAGISIPNGGFVLRVLAVYLIVLAPLNWAVFRL
jgi:hypothetical protein